MLPPNRYPAPQGTEYQFVGPNYHQYGEVQGYDYDPYSDQYYINREAAEAQGLIQPKPKDPSLMDTLLPVAGAAAAYTVGQEGGEYIGGLLQSKPAPVDPSAVPNGTAGAGATQGATPTQAATPTPTATPDSSFGGVQGNEVVGSSANGTGGEGLLTGSGETVTVVNKLPDGNVTLSNGEVVPESSITGAAEGGVSVGQVVQGAAGLYNVYSGIDDGNYAQAGVGAVQVGAAAGSQTASAIAGPAALALGAHQLYQLTQHGNGDADSRKSGAAAGASAGAAYGGSVGGIYGAAIGAVIGGLVGLAGGSIKTGKHIGVQRRDTWRNALEQKGLFTKQDDGTGRETHHIQLADGSFYNVGVDGKDALGHRDVSNKDLIAPGRDSDYLSGNDYKLSAYERDYTNDLEAMIGVGADSLNNAMFGGSIDATKNSEQLQMANYLSNAAISNAGSRDFTIENWTTGVNNLRQFYNNIGIKDKELAFGMSQELFDNGKITEEEHQQMNQGFNLVFDDYEDSFALANQLNETRFDAALAQAEQEDEEDSQKSITGVTPNG